KARLRNSVVAVHTPEARRVRDVVQAAAGVNSAVLVGDGVHLLLDDARKRIPELQSLLNSASVPFENVEQISATVEDVFVSAVESSDRGAR
ncbi:MAG TPA: ABC transporter ATP-binding protein, partial [Clostridia bacterium]|nr:ABC transporter ATP-binding protein [Clostridia bacterium]